MINPSFNPHWQTDPLKSTRAGFGAAILDLGKQNDQVVVVTADLADSTKVEAFKQTYPDRFFDLGVAEQNLAGIGAGLAASGLIPFCTSYAMFSPGRNWDQLRNSICYPQANVKVVSTHAGLSVGPDGATHQALEDIALTRVLPHLTVLSPVDYHQSYQATLAASAHLGPVYLRLSRPDSPQITTPTTPFKLGQNQTLVFGDTATIVSTGFLIPECLKAAAETGAEVINVHTIKPLDIDSIIQSTSKTDKLIIVEEHQKAGGLGSAIFEAFVDRGIPLPPTKHLAVNDQFGQSGTPAELLEAYGLTWPHIVDIFTQF